MPLTPESWMRVKDIVASALDVNVADRETFLRESCAGDSALLAEAQSLLAFDSPVLTDALTPEPTQLLSTGTVLKDRYVIHNRLQMGGFATTYIALDRQLLNRRVVIKVLDYVEDEPYLLRKFHEELVALSSLEHPNIVAPLDSGQLPGGAPFIVMQFAEGKTLRTLLAEPLMPLERAASILSQLGRTLAFIHHKGIYHRDLKPENTIVQTFEDGTDHVRVIDFGIASIANAETSAKTRIIGTLNYMAPEQLRGDVSACSDIYALGVMAYELVTGEVPFNASSPVELAEMQRKGVITRPSQLRLQLHSSADALILNALSFQPSRRPADAAEFAERLGDAILLTTKKSRVGPRWILFTVAALIFVLLASLTLWKKFSHTQAAPVVSEISHDSPATTVSAAPPPGLSIELLKRETASPLQVDPSGVIRFEPGDDFRIRVLPLKPGHLYVFSEDDASGNSLHILFPSPTANGGASKLGPGTAFLMPGQSWFHFGAERHEQSLLIAWSVSEQAELEQAVRWANPHDRGRIGSKEECAAIAHLLQNHENQLSWQNGEWRFASDHALAVGSIRFSPL